MKPTEHCVYQYKAIELAPHYDPAIDNRRVILALQPGERLNRGQTRQVDFYADRYRAQQSSSPMARPIRFSQSR
ncbi:MAG: hypothetical protein DMG13_25845 [Acidobacteria bacterium]|nr:MAG: hypothetical protein DMG13_25845 [Acidobacteriota bacterium]